MLPCNTQVSVMARQPQAHKYQVSTPRSRSHRERSKVYATIATIHDGNHPTIRATTPMHDRVMAGKVRTGFRAVTQHGSEQTSLRGTLQINCGWGTGEPSTNGVVLKAWTRSFLCNRVGSTSSYRDQQNESSESNFRLHGMFQRPNG